MQQVTSKEAYQSIRKELGNKQKEVLRAISILKEPSNLEIANFLGLPINRITGRTNELVKYGYVIASSTKIGSTGKRVISWKLASWHSPYDAFIPNTKEDGHSLKRKQNL